jgi:pimeloyl-ACP methyl ester carboxylesterase
MPGMATYALIHGAGDSGWCWHLVERELRALGHDTVAVDLPCEDDSAGWREYADAVAGAVGERDDLVVVGHSLAGFTAPLVGERVPVSGLVLVAAMVPAPGETASEWWSASGYEAAMEGRDLPDDEAELFYNRTPPELVEEAKGYWRDQSDTPMREPWPLDAWPDVPTRYVLGRDDRCFPADFVRVMVRERLGIEPEEIDGDHAPFLSRPQELAATIAVPLAR